MNKGSPCSSNKSSHCPRQGYNSNNQLNKWFVKNIGSPCSRTSLTRSIQQYLNRFGKTPHYCKSCQSSHKHCKSFASFKMLFLNLVVALKKAGFWVGQTSALIRLIRKR